MKFGKKIAVFSSIVGASVVGGIAFAAWTADGTGSGYAQAKTAQAVSTVSATTSAQLYPGGSGDLVLKVVNPNDYPVTITAVSNDTSNGKTIKTVAADAACDASTGVSFANQSGLSLVVPANSSGTVHTLTGVVSMSNDSANACSGDAFNIPVAISAASSAQ